MWITIKITRYGDANKTARSIERSANKIFERSAKNYTIAWECLNERYNNKRILVQSHTKAIFDLDLLEDESALKLRKFLDKLFDSATPRAWEVQGPKSEISEVSDSIQFLKKRFQVLEAVEGAQNLHGKAKQKTRAADQKEKKYSGHPRKNRTSMHVTTSKFKCYTVDAAYKTRGYKVQSLIRLKIVWNGPD
ncbi:DUF1758 domain-containing protein, partial [Aphis craccivora]